MAKVYGSPTPSAFLREMVGAMVSGQESRVLAFNARLFERMTGQMALSLQAETQRKAELLTPRKTLTKRKTRTKRKTHDRPT